MMTLDDVAAALEGAAGYDLQFGVTAVVNGHEVWLPPHEHRQALNDLLRRDGLAYLWARLSPSAKRALGALLFADARTRQGIWRRLDDAAKPYVERLLRRLGVPPAG